jgi:nucleotide-binding universal stress UspA family protein
MFKKILIPVDGSELSSKAAVTGVNLAGEVGASVVFLHAMMPYIAPYAADVAMIDDKTQMMFEQSIVDGSAKILADARVIAAAANVSAESVGEVDSRPEVLIEKTVKALGCDLVVIATHGRGALGRLLMGSVTTSLLSILTVPVLIYRDGTMIGD